MSEYILEMQHISKSFPGVKALNDVSLRLRPGSVHALMGENGAGKSTLMKCLFGIYKQDEGQIILDGEKVDITDSRTALGLGISMIHQELYPVLQQTVMENLWLGRFPLKSYGPLKLVDHKKMKADTEALFKEIDVDIDPLELAGNLSVSKLQSIEIAKAVSHHSRIIVMDEPTSSLTSDEVEHLFKIINGLKAKGVAIIYISHKMEEILRISDEVTIMRDGNYIGTWPSDELTTDLIIKRMVGREMTQLFPEKTNVPGEEVLRVENMTSIRDHSFKGVNFSLRKGEVLGIDGLVGAQRTEVIEALFGLRHLADGKIFIHGKEVKIRSPRDAKKHHIALLTEERRATGIFPMLNIVDNNTMACMPKYRNKVGLLNDRLREIDTEEGVSSLRIKTPDTQTRIQSLSGGNQQKVLISRWLNTNPEILLLDEPTRGIDVGAKYEIYTIINRLATQGKSVIMISSEMSELLGMSDRIMVMSNGKMEGILDAKDATEEKIMELATAGLL